MAERNQIMQALVDSAITYRSHGSETKTLILCEEQSLLISLREIEVILEKVLSSDRVLYSVHPKARGFGLQHVQAPKLGQSLMSLLTVDIDQFYEYLPLCKFNPYFDLFAKYSVDEELQDLMQMSGILTALEGGALVRKLNEFVAAVRAEARKVEFKRNMNNFGRSARKNHKSFVDYIDGLFDVYSKLNVLRLDLAYKRAHSFMRYGRGDVLPYRDVKRHREQFIKTLPGYLEKKLSKKCMVGFAWKLEYGLVKSWHYHVMIFLDGQVTRQDVPLAKLIGEYWTLITEDKGLYYNCNAHKAKYKSCGIGLIGHRDTKLREGLKKAALYMTKTDYYVKVQAPDKGRTFGKGVVPKRKRRGRPRTVGGKPIKYRHLSAMPRMGSPGTRPPQQSVREVAETLFLRPCLF